MRVWFKLRADCRTADLGSARSAGWPSQADIPAGVAIVRVGYRVSGVSSQAGGRAVRVHQRTHVPGMGRAVPSVRDDRQGRQAGPVTRSGGPRLGGRPSAGLMCRRSPHWLTGRQSPGSRAVSTPGSRAVSAPGSRAVSTPGSRAVSTRLMGSQTPLAHGPSVPWLTGRQCPWLTGRQFPRPVGLRCPWLTGRWIPRLTRSESRPGSSVRGRLWVPIAAAPCPRPKSSHLSWAVGSRSVRSELT